MAAILGEEEKAGQCSLAGGAQGPAASEEREGSLILSGSFYRVAGWHLSHCSPQDRRWSPARRRESK